jgi:hypothetical protein
VGEAARTTRLSAPRIAQIFLVSRVCTANVLYIEDIT